MEFDVVLSKFNEIFQDVLENDEIALQFETTADDLDEWDSINHISLVVEIESEFQVTFTANEIRSFKNVGEMATGVIKKMS
jgi:acyl carrier protein